MANITVLDNVGASVVFNAATPSAGDRSPAVWRDNSASSVAGYRPEFRVLSRDNGKRTARHLSISMRYPVTFTDLATGRVSLLATIPFSLEVTLPTNIDVADNRNAYVEFANLVTSSLLRDVAETGFAPT
jgi:hypothetical protein